MTIVSCPVCTLEWSFSAPAGTNIQFTCSQCKANVYVTDKGAAIRKMAVAPLATLNGLRVSKVREYQEAYKAYAEHRIREYQDNLAAVDARCQKVYDAASEKAARMREAAETERLAKAGAKVKYEGKPESDRSGLPATTIVTMLIQIIDTHHMLKQITDEESAAFKRELTTLTGCRKVGRHFGLANI